MGFPVGIFFKVHISQSGGARRRSLIPLRPRANQLPYQHFDGKIWHHCEDNRGRKDRRRCRRFPSVCSLRRRLAKKNSSLRFNLGQLTERIDGESDEFDEEEVRQTQRKGRRWQAKFFLSSQHGSHSLETDLDVWWCCCCCCCCCWGGGGH